METGTGRGQSSSPAVTVGLGDVGAGPATREPCVRVCECDSVHAEPATCKTMKGAILPQGSQTGVTSLPFLPPPVRRPCARVRGPSEQAAPPGPASHRCL